MRLYVFLFLFLPFYGFTQSYELSSLTSSAKSSLRGLSVVSDSVAWASGSNGYIGRTADGGKNWRWMQPSGYAKADFRDIEAFDALNAIAVSAGSPAYVIVTNDGGKSWKETYKNLDSAIFLDGMDFWDDKNGIIFGDPIHNKLQLLITNDGGISWTDISAKANVEMAEGEAAFAASGTSIKTMAIGNVWIATGGSKSNIYFSENFGMAWQKYEVPILHGQNSAGVFSIDFYDNNRGIAVGGDYTKDKENSNNIQLTTDGGKTWHKPAKPVYGFRSGVLWYDEKNCFATGTSGTDVSRDGGKNWYHISDESFNVIKKAKKGNVILLAGNNGLIYSLKLK